MATPLLSQPRYRDSYRLGQGEARERGDEDVGLLTRSSATITSVRRSNPLLPAVDCAPCNATPSERARTEQGVGQGLSYMLSLRSSLRFPVGRYGGSGVGDLERIKFRATVGLQARFIYTQGLERTAHSNPRARVAPFPLYLFSLR